MEKKATETDAGLTDKPRDRKLGDEWADWKGDGRDQVIEENLSTFFFLSAGVILIFVALLPLVWYLVKPRIVLLNPFMAIIMERVLTVGVVLLLVLLALEGIAVLKFRKSFFPYSLMEGLLLSVLPKAIWLGSKLGISRDRVGNSFIKAHNFFTRSRGGIDAERLLILLPRCLKSEARSRIVEKVSSEALKVLTVAGGEQARDAIRDLKPTLILALACERDLMSGIKDVADKIPVLAIPNRRPEGPCKNTDFSTEELDEILSFIRESRYQKSSRRN